MKDRREDNLTKCDEDGIHDFINDGDELYANQGEDENLLMKRPVKCEDCGKKAMEYYILLERHEID